MIQHMNAELEGENVIVDVRLKLPLMQFLIYAIVIIAALYMIEKSN